jgi:anti-sigma B factor antagonist
MTLKITVARTSPPTLALAGRLDTNTALQLDDEIDRLLAGGAVQRLVFDLDYLSSAGIRCFIRARKAIEPVGGKVAVVHPKPAVRKVLDIVKALPGGIFTSTTELDAYLDDIQKQMQHKD